ncbi:MAG: hypothetical protein R3Y43_06415 [Alphaproteobacteria bacterium]
MTDDEFNKIREVALKDEFVVERMDDIHHVVNLIVAEQNLDEVEQLKLTLKCMFEEGVCLRISEIVDGDNNFKCHCGLDP